MTGIIILAAGSSGRLGTAKQNLMYQGLTLLQRSVNAASSSVGYSVLVVLGSNFDLIKPTINDGAATIIYNSGWEEGMASSVRLGVQTMKKIEPGIDSVLLMLCDQPFVSSALLNQLIRAKLSKKIIACAYNETIGAPVLFDQLYFGDLITLKGQEGAKKVLLKYPGEVITIPFASGSIDIDTMEDYEKLI